MKLLINHSPNQAYQFKTRNLLQILGFFYDICAIKTFSYSL